ncbi:MAG: DUF1186 domain-containing protein [Chloroflexi bacterium]|nr:DUF1186 domain-containing protein [Chloroflexota bacterium]
MTDSIDDLVSELTPENNWPSPELLTAIVEQGEAMVTPLCQILSDPEMEGWSLHYAAYLLALHGSPQAIPALANTFRLFDTDFLESTSDALSAFGEAAIEPALAAARDPEPRWYPRAMAITAAVEAARDDTVLKERVAASLREMLADFVARQGSLTEDEIELVSSVVTDLSSLADPAARELIEAAFVAELVDELVIDRKDVQRAYGKGDAHPRREFKPHEWFEDYPADYRRHQEEDVKRAKENERQKQKPRGLTKPVAAPKLGRNEPCWCGSGKKYKHCHLQSDTK